MRKPDLIFECRRLCGEVEQHLPGVYCPGEDATFLSPSGTLVTVKIATKFAAAAGALAWRAHDFATLACELFDAKRIIPGAVIARSLMETVALTYVVHKKAAMALATRNLQLLDQFLVRCLSGNRLGAGDPESPNVLAAIDLLEKEPGCDRFKDFYAVLCEFAHPNALGAFYACADFDDSGRSVSFGHNRGLTKSEDAAFAVVFALEVLLEFIKKIEELIPSLVALAIDLYPVDTTDLSTH